MLIVEDEQRKKTDIAYAALDYKTLKSLKEDKSVNGKAFILPVRGVSHDNKKLYLSVYYKRQGELIRSNCLAEKCQSTRGSCK